MVSINCKGLATLASVVVREMQTTVWYKPLLWVLIED